MQPADGSSRAALGLLIVALLIVVTAWWWIGAAVIVPSSQSGPQKLDCISYAPFRGSQTPLDPDIRVTPTQIEEDLRRLAPITGCIRTYSISNGLDQIPPVAGRLGLKVIQGLWLSSNRARNRTEIDGAIGLANRYPQVISALVVGNEVLLRGELSAGDLAKTMHEVKAAVPVPITYADVWEFWLRNRDLAAAADFITVHILPYWEDDPVAARAAGDHVEAIRKRVATAFPGREVLIGEVGWPSQGRMRQGALPSPSSQAYVIADVVARAARQGYRVNVIEAFDQPWKRALEGTVGGYWGLFDGYSRTAKFVLGQPVSDHPYWPWQALGGAIFVIGIFAAARWGGGGAPNAVPSLLWLVVAVIAASGGIFAGWAIERCVIESFGIAGAARGAALAFLAVAVPPVASIALTRGETLPSFAQMLGTREERPATLTGFAIGALLILLTLVATEVTLGLVFDPRYRDFPFAAFTAATAPFLLLRLVAPREEGSFGAAEIVGSALLVLGASFIVFNEGIANWQALWLAGTLLALALTLVLARDAQGS
ncbi:MAG: beta-(1-6) glucans synthase [Xanthobacteraceae bacterium]